jgi:hypothetical protein
MILRIDDVIASNGKRKSGMNIHPEMNEEFWFDSCQMKNAQA